MKASIRNKYDAIIGLEVHAQLRTNSKIYNTDSSQFGSSPNTNVSAITLGHPGTLPRLNKKAFEFAMKMGIACNSEISSFNIFDRKNYFYPDLPKGYQITQDRTPICKGGCVKINSGNGSERNISLTKIHLEEDAGKSIHLPNEVDTLVDFNRSGVPLIEIVTEPVIKTSEEACAFLTEVRKLVRYLEICDGNMEEGSLRCDANVSVMLKGVSEFGKKVEIKNMNSIRNVQHAIDFEIERQIEVLEKMGNVISETRTFDAVTGKSFSMRVKEELNDYRYFPDPDISPVIVSDHWVAEIRKAMPALPWELQAKFESEYGLSGYDAGVLTETKEIALYFEEICNHTHNFKAAANWTMGPVKSYLNERSLSITEFPVTSRKIAEVIQAIDDGVLNFSIASQRLLPELIKNQGESPLELAKRLNFVQESGRDALLTIIDQVIDDFPAKVQEFKKGKKGIIGMFVGEIVKRSKGKADPKVTNELLIEKLKSI